MKRIADIPKHDRPREKLQNRGPKALSDLELLAVLLGKGTKGHDVMALASQILKMLDNHKGQISFEQLRNIKGVGPAKATLLLAAHEFFRRRIRPEGVKIRFSTDVLPLLQHYADRKQEHFLCISLNGSNEVIETRTITIGLVNKTLIHPREVFAYAITDRAAAIIVAHNHPSGSLTPSKDDIKITHQLKASGETLGIRLLDHIIFNHKGYYSFLEAGKL
jgi:DNA repair protein RadC